MRDLKKYSIVITGAATGNGYEIAKVCSQYFSKLILIDKDKNELQKAKDKIIFNKNHNEFTIDLKVCDFLRMEEIYSLINYLHETNEHIHCLVNNAGVSIETNSNLTIEKQLEIWEQTIKINLTAPYYLSIGLKDIIPNNIGTIINITSINSTLAFPNNPAYMASKGGLRQLSRSLAYDLSERKIRVNSIAPGYFKTNMTKKSWEDTIRREYISSKTLLNRWGESSEIGNIVCFLASNISSYITGQEIYVDGGWSIKGI